jgi:hypothetical protein
MEQLVLSLEAAYGMWHSDDLQETSPENLNVSARFLSALFDPPHCHLRRIDVTGYDPMTQ